METYFAAARQEVVTLSDVSNNNPGAKLGLDVMICSQNWFGALVFLEYRIHILSHPAPLCITTCMLFGVHMEGVYNTYNPLSIQRG